jgi:hypothetical protein
MVISKDIIGTIDIDTQNGRVWVNAPNCILRIQGLEFKDVKEKFSMIDVSGKKASMIEGDLVLDDKRLVRFILDLFSSLSYHFMNGKIKDKDKFIDSMYDEISKMIENQTFVGGV